MFRMHHLAVLGADSMHNEQIVADPTDLTAQGQNQGDGRPAPKTGSAIAVAIVHNPLLVPAGWRFVNKKAL